MPAPAKGSAASLPRRIFRACRITALLVLFFIIAAGAYLNEVGLPGFLKRPLIQKLHDRGLDLQFTRLRLRWHRGVVAEHVLLGRAGPANTGGPVVSLREVELQLNHRALVHFKLNVDSLILRDGQLAWPLTDSNQPPLELAATNIQTQLRFLTNDQWRLDNFTADFAGAKLSLSAAVTNASVLRDLKFFHPTHNVDAQLTLQRLRQLARVIEQLKFSAPPGLQIEFSGDARQIESFNGVLTLKAPGADTPWGNLTNGSLVVHLVPPNFSNQLPHAEIELRAASARVGVAVDLTNLQLHATATATESNLSGLDLELRADAALVQDAVGLTNLQLRATASALQNLTNLIHAHLEASAGALQTPWAQAAAAHLVADWDHSPTNPIPTDGFGQMQLTGLRTRWVSAGSLDLYSRMSPTSNSPASPTYDWAWWADLAPYALDWNCRLHDVHTEDPGVGAFEFKELDCVGSWLAPDLVLTNAHAELYRGNFNARASVNVASRAATFDATSDFDVQKAAPLLTPFGRTWLEQYSWEDPPRIHGQGAAILPAWTNRQPDWRAEVLPTLSLHGDVRASAAAFRNIPVSSASLHFSYSNMIWNIPDLVAERPEGRLILATEDNDRTKRYHFKFHSTVDPKIVRHLLPENAQTGLDYFIFTQPPVLDADIWGQWHDLSQIGCRAHVDVTNFALRGESATHFQGDFQFTNNFIILTGGRVENGDRFMTADGLGIDPEARKAYVTNGYSTMEPTAFFHVIGPKVTHIMAPYQFSEPPTVRAWGTIPFNEEVAPDLHFQVEGSQFHWMRFNLDHVSGHVDWVGKTLTFTNSGGDFYEGKMTADALFDFTPHDGADFSFNLNVNNANLHSLMTDIYSSTNHLDGRLNGVLQISKANSEDFSTWNGVGTAELHDGFIWAIPIFGIFSPVLNNLLPGLGESRASQGSGAFTITNSIIYSDNVEIRAPALRMQYRGSVDFKSKVDAVVEARLLRDVPVFGWLVSTAFSPVTKLFQYKVTGTLTEPKTEPQFLVTKIPLMLLNPIQTLREIMPPDKSPPTSQPQPKGPLD